MDTANSTITILSSADIERLISIPMAVEAVERAYVEKNSGGGGIWPMVFHEFSPGVADLDIKSGDLAGCGCYGLKLVSWFGQNPGRGLPALYGTSLLFDISTGAPAALLNAGGITAYRTGAAAAIAAKHLARADSETLLVCGCGELAPYLVAAALYTMPGIKRVLLANPRSPEKARAACPGIFSAAKALLHRTGIELCAAISPVDELESAVGASDIIFTATPARAPYIRAGWVRPGTHLSCIGADMSGKEEVDPALLAAARVFGDDTAQCLSVSECELPYRSGVISGLTGEIGQVIAKTVPGRVSDDCITLFDSTGIALQDISCAAALLRAAEAQGVGTKAAL